MPNSPITTITEISECIQERATLENHYKQCIDIYNSLEKEGASLQVQEQVQVLTALSQAQTPPNELSKALEGMRITLSNISRLDGQIKVIQQEIQKKKSQRTTMIIIGVFLSLLILLIFFCVLVPVLTNYLGR